MNEEFIEKRAKELQVYLQIISHDNLLREDETFKLFLTCESREEFEQWKNSKKQNETPTTTFDTPSFYDSFNYIYSSLKAKFINTKEPEELQLGEKLEENLVKTTQYLSFIHKSLKMLEEKEVFLKRCLAYEESIIKSLDNVTSTNPDFTKTIHNAADFHIKRSNLLKVRFT